ncbi:hypothetical protein ACN9TB_00890 [Lactococcus lactis]
MAKASKNKLNQLKGKLKKEQEHLVKTQETINDLIKQIEGEQMEIFMKTLKEAGVEIEEAIDTVLMIGSDQSSAQFSKDVVEDKI